jgi:hypothetical protein
MAGRDSLGEKPFLDSFHDLKNERFCDYRNDEKHRQSVRCSDYSTWEPKNAFRGSEKVTEPRYGL